MARIITFNPTTRLSVAVASTLCVGSKCKTSRFVSITQKKMLKYPKFNHLYQSFPNSCLIIIWLPRVTQKKKQHTKQVQLHTSKAYEALALCRYWISCKYFLNSVCSQYKQLWNAFHALVIVYGSWKKLRRKCFWLQGQSKAMSKTSFFFFSNQKVSI